MTGASGAMLSVEALLAPVPGENPAGADLRYSLLYDKIKAARRAAEDKAIRAASAIPEEAAMGGIGQAGASPEQEWLAIEKLASEALAKQSKDLQLAVWLLEARVRLTGFEGVAAGLQLVRGLLEGYWASLYPSIDEEDDDPLAMRVAVMQWLDQREKLPLIVKSVPLTGPGTEYGLLHYEVTQRTGKEKDELLSSGWPSSEKFEEAIDSCSTEYLDQLDAEISACQEQVGLLEQVASARFVIRRRTPSGTERTETLLSFSGLGEILENCRWLVARALAKKPERVGEAPTFGEEVEPASAVSGEATSASEPEREMPAAAMSRETALARLAGAIEYLLGDNNLDPTPYLLSRALAFGVLYAYDDVSEAMPLSSPPTDVRERLRTLHTERQWNELVAEAEAFLRVSPKQAWLDLHRYVVSALEQLGSHRRAAEAVRGQVRTLLSVHPGLVDAEFSDGTPTAGQETRAWLRETGLFGEPAPLVIVRAPAPAEPRAEVAEQPATEQARDEALRLARSGRVADALELLQSQVAAASSGRERFMRRLELAELCLETGSATLAFPMLDELARIIERARLEEWEDREVIARVWVALVRCCRDLSGDAEAQARGKEVFAQLCRFDISKALSVDKDSSSAASRWFRR